jgi:hypothetical protein
VTAGLERSPVSLLTSTRSDRYMAMSSGKKNGSSQAIYLGSIVFGMFIL